MNLKGSSDDLKTIVRIASRILQNLDYYEKNNPKLKGNPIVKRKTNILGETTNEYKIYNEKYKDIKEASILPFYNYLKILKDNKNIEIWHLKRHKSEIKTMEKGIRIINYKAPLGKFFSNDIGDIFKINKCQYKILEKVKFKPKKIIKYWDGQNNLFYLKFGKITADSLIKLLKTIFNEKNLDEILRLEDKDIENLLEKKNLNKQIFIDANISLGQTREKIIDSHLRDLYSLNDKLQEEIFRQSLNNRIILTGIAGTGKTSVLIKRVSKNIDIDFVEEEDKNILTEREKAILFDLNHNPWLSFSPNEKVKDYLKIAFNNEGVLADERFLKTWFSFRYIFLRDLKIIDENNIFKINKKLKITQSNILSFKNNKSIIKYSVKFENFIAKLLKKELIALINILKNYTNKYQSVKKIFFYFKEIKTNEKYMKLFANFETLSRFMGNIENELKKDANEHLKKLPNQKILHFKKELINYYRENEKEQKYKKIKDLYDKELIEFLSNEIIDISKNNSRKDFLNNLVKLRIISKIMFKKFLNMNKALYILKQIHQFKHISENIPRYYLDFRKSFLKKRKNKIDKNLISEIELDIILYQVIKNLKYIIETNYQSDKFIKYPNKIADMFQRNLRTQVLIDEIADFNTIQVGCIVNLSHPKFNSVFLTGDLLQRTYSLGISEWNELDYVLPNYKVYKLKKVYRHTHRLLDLIKKLYEMKFNEQPDIDYAYSLKESDPYPLKYFYKDKSEHLHWIVERVNEVYFREENQLPSTAIFVNDESQIEYITNSLNLINSNEYIKFDSCYKGEISDKRGVKILSINYIKGYEFECVFILDIDKLRMKYESLLTNLLYVAITRAGAYLAITYSEEFPKELSQLENDFILSNWEKNNVL